MASRPPSPHEFLLIAENDEEQFNDSVAAASALGFAMVEEKGAFQVSVLQITDHSTLVWSLLMVRDREPRTPLTKAQLTGGSWSPHAGDDE